MKNLHIENSFTTWNKYDMFTRITDLCKDKYGSYLADKLLNRTYIGMFIEWWLHNLGYYVTLPFCCNKAIKNINLRCRDLDLEEHK